MKGKFALKTILFNSIRTDSNQTHSSLSLPRTVQRQAWSTMARTMLGNDRRTNDKEQYICRWHGTGSIMTRGLGRSKHPRGLTPSGGGSGPRVMRPPLSLSPRGIGPLPFRPRGPRRPDPLWVLRRVYGLGEHSGAHLTAFIAVWTSASRRM